MKRRLKITVTKIQRQAMTIAPTIFHAFCPVCAREVEMLTRADSIKILEIDNSMLEDLIIAGKVHTTETAGGNLRVCKDSLYN